MSYMLRKIGIWQTPGLQDQQSPDRTGSTTDGESIHSQLKLEVELRDSEIQRLLEEINKICDNRDTLASELDRLEGKYAEESAILHKAIHERNNTINCLHRQTEHMAKEIHVLDRERNQLKNDVRVAQEGTFRLARQSRVTAQDDSSIRAHFSKLEVALRAWARKYSIESICLSTEEIQNLIALLEGTCKDLDSDNLTNLHEVELGNRMPSLCVQAALSKTIFAHTFDHPFFFLDSMTETQRQDVLDPHQETFGHHLSCLYKELQSADPEEAHMWRSKTLQLLNTSGKDPTDNSGTTDTPSVKEKMEAKREHVYQHLALKFLDSADLLLCQLDMPGDIEKRKESLRSLFRTAGELSTSLWTQRTYLKCLGLSELGNFNIESPLMVAHRLQKLEDDDHRLDGNMINAVIQPAVVAFGNENGENYDSYKVWAKATVLVQE